MTESDQHITCQEVVELVTDYLEHALDIADTSAFEQHLNFCDGCATYVEQMRVTVDTLGHVEEGDLPRETRDRLLTAFRDWKRASGVRRSRTRRAATGPSPPRGCDADRGTRAP